MVRTSLPAQPARRRRPPADRVPGALRAALRRRLSRRGRPELPALLPRLLRAAALAPRRWATLPLDTYDGLFVPNHGLQRRQPDRRTTARASWRRSRCPTAATSTTPPTRRRGCEDRARRPRRSSSTLGCPYGCDFCSKPIFGNVVRRRDLDAVFAEIEQIRALGYDSLWIADDTFTLEPALSRGVLPAHRPAGA